MNSYISDRVHAILGILSTILIPVVSAYVNRANNQVDIAHARLLLVSTTIAIGADGLGNGIYTANEDGSSPLPYRELLGPTWPKSRIGNTYFVVNIDFSRDLPDAIWIIRDVNGVEQIYQTANGVFE